MGVLYKYRACGVNTDKIFTTGCLHFSSPRDFNDPYDSILLLDKSKVFYKRVVCLYKDNTIKEKFVEITPDMIAQVYQKVLDRSHIYCLSTEGRQMQMWSHYAKNHTGICLEFDDDLLCNSLGDMYKVDYRPEQYELKLTTPEQPENDLRGVICTKERGWIYEQEVRIFRASNSLNDDKNYPFNKQALKAIYFGSFCTPRNIRKYKRLCRENGFEYVKFYQMHLANNGNYELIPTEI